MTIASLRHKQLALAFAFFSASPLVADTSLETDRACKPVFPHIVVKLNSDGSDLKGHGLLILYYEEVGAADDIAKSSTGPRMKSCRTNEGVCVATRARFEMRLDGNREQRIQIRETGTKEKGNPILGEVRWMGPSYPDVVNVTCDQTIGDPIRACTLDSFVNYPLGHPHDARAVERHVKRHDQCQPWVKSEDWS